MSDTPLPRLAILESMHLGTPLISSMKGRHFRLCPEFSTSRWGGTEGEHYGRNQERVNTQRARAMVRAGLIEVSAVGSLSLVYGLTEKGREVVSREGRLW